MSEAVLEIILYDGAPFNVVVNLAPGEDWWVPARRIATTDGAAAEARHVYYPPQSIREIRFTSGSFSGEGKPAQQEAVPSTSFADWG